MLSQPLLNKLTRRRPRPTELLLVPMIDIFTVLVTFLLMTAVFSKITIVQLDLPSASAGKAAEPAFRLEVIVRKDGFELTNGSALIAAIPKVNGEYDIKALSELALALKREHPQTDAASVLMEPDVSYEELIHAMDAIRSADVPATDPQLLVQAESGPQTDIRAIGDAIRMKVALFTKIAVGDAP